jgi:ankyrin repeat protein
VKVQSLVGEKEAKMATKQCGKMPGPIKASGEAMHIACMLGHREHFAAMIEAGESIEERDRTRMTPAMVAAKYGHAECLRLAMDAGCDIEAEDESGCTALIWAAQSDSAECLAELIAKGADLEAKDDEGWTAAVWALISDAPQCLALLIEAGCELGGPEIEPWSAALDDPSQGDARALYDGEMLRRHLEKSIEAGAAAGALRM